MKLLLALCFLVGCGSTNKKVSEDPTRRENDEPIVDCQGKVVEKGYLAPGFKYIDGNRLWIKNSNMRRVSLCEAAKNNKAVVFQFAGITCLSCQHEAVYLSKNIRSSDVEHAVVFTDFPEDYSELEFYDFMKAYAKGSKRYHDDNINLWKMFSRDPKYPVRPTVLVFGKNGVSFLYNTEGEDIETSIKDVVYEISGTFSPPTPEPKPRPDPGPSPIPEPDVPGLSPDFDVVELGGFVRRLSHFFTKEYALVDFSQWNCIFCKRAADSHNQDYDYQNTITSGNCDAITFLPKTDLDSWAGRYMGTFVGKRSVGPTEGNLRDVAAKYGFTLTGTPSYLIVNRSGQVLDSGVGALPRSFDATCKRN